MSEPTRLLFVCLGNICRSPTAEAVMRQLVGERGLQGWIEVDSAGTGSWHVGERPDERAVAAGRRRGLVFDGSARQVRPLDFERFDLILAMDRANVRDLLALAPSAGSAEKVRLLREFDPAAVHAGELDVPDPYYGAAQGFERVLDLVQAACEGVIDHIGPPVGRDRR